MAAVLALWHTGLLRSARGRNPFMAPGRLDLRDCNAPFRFAERRYTPPGASPMRILRLRKDGRSHRITMEQNDTVVVTVKGRSMLWQSECSGDFFELKRCP